MIFCSSQGIMLVYDITNEKSFENIKNWIRNIEEVSTDTTAFFTCLIVSDDIWSGHWIKQQKDLEGRSMMTHTKIFDDK